MLFGISRGYAMFENLALSSVKQNGEPDIETIRQYHDDVLYRFAILAAKMGFSKAGYKISAGEVPDIIISGYRDHKLDPEVKNSPHNFAIALDIQVSSLNSHEVHNQPAVLERQVDWITEAIGDGLFTRAGFYPQQNTIHLDIADKSWMEKYNGTPFWVKWNKNYKGFYILNEAIDYAEIMIKAAQRGTA
jgi:hypothetical protein